MLAAKLKQFFVKYQVAYLVLNHERKRTLEGAMRALNLNLSNVIQSIPLHDGQTALIAILPFNSQIDFNKLAQVRPGNYRLLTDEEASSYFYDCEFGSYPPFGEPYGLPLIVDLKIAQAAGIPDSSRVPDDSKLPDAFQIPNASQISNTSNIVECDEVYFESGSLSSKIYMTLEDFLFLINDAPVFDLVADPQITPTDTHAMSKGIQSEMHNPMHNEMKYEMQRNMQYEMQYSAHSSVISPFLPELPPIAKEILKLKEVPLPLAVQKLPELISQDAYLNANILVREALNDAMADTSSFDALSHIAIGISAVQLFKLPLDGPMGLNGFWRHAVLAAELAEALAMKASNRSLLNPKLCHLLGLMQNFGFLLFGHLFLPEFRLLNKWMVVHPRISVEILERKLIGMGQAHRILNFGHAQLGAWLMHYWQMPESIIKSVAAHHQAHYDGPFKEYVYLIQLTNHLLRGVGIGDGEIGNGHIHRLSKVLGYPELLVHDTLNSVLNNENFETMAKSLAT